jgi:DNA polymerase delta subunit 4
LPLHFTSHTQPTPHTHTYNDRQKFGPALGLTRLERWERADKLALNPPADVYKILTEIDGAGKWASCVWEGIV